MSILSSISRYAADYRARRRQAQTYLEIANLPHEIRKDIGWPDAYVPQARFGAGHTRAH